MGVPGWEQQLKVDYLSWMRQALPHQEEFCRWFSLPCSPLVAQGWDSSPRTVQSDIYDLSAVIHSDRLWWTTRRSSFRRRCRL